MKRTVWFVLLLLPLFFACNKNPYPNIPENALFKIVPASESGVDFINKIVNEKDYNIFTYRNFYNGGGVGIADLNNDGLADIYMTSNREKNKLYLNLGDFTFKEIAGPAGVEGERAWATGVAMVDINADGWLDIYVCNAGNIEGDDQKNELFINNGDLTFTEKAEEYGLADNGFTTHAAFFDYDNDGDLDVYILNNSFIPVSSLGYSNRRNLRSEEWTLPDMFRGGGDKMMRNDNGKFVDVSEEAGVFGSLIGFGMGVTIGDVNRDMLPDIYVSNDFYERDYLYINNGDGTFTESLKDWIEHLSMSSMGADLADINNDGYSEIFVTDMLPEGDARLKNTSEFEGHDIFYLKKDLDFYNQYMQNALHLNNGDQTFSEIAFYSGVAQTDWSWGALLLDLDNDGYRDIYVSNGIYHDLTDMDFMDFFANEIVQEMTLTGEKEEVENIINQMPSNPIPNYALKNNGDLTFTNAYKEWGFDIPSFSNGSAYGDLDNDGDLDLVVSNVNQTCFLFKNTTSDRQLNNYLSVNLKGNGKNSFAVGAAVYVYHDDQILKQEQFPTRGFQSSVDYRLNFGLNKLTQVDSVVVYWPNGKKQTLTDVKANTTLDLNIENAGEFSSMAPAKRAAATYFETVEVPFQKHQENFYVDFDYEGLIPQMSSKEGPAIQIGDVNSDKLDDLFIGGASDQEAQLWIQKTKGNFVLQTNSSFANDKGHEDVTALFFDADGDNDLDLFVGSGGNDKPETSALLSDRLYLNDSKGNFKRSTNSLPDMRYNTSVAAANDFDNDGDLDLFVGNLGVSKIYGINPKQYLLENDGKGNFTDITESKAFKLMDVGMVNDAIWCDMDHDDNKELIVVGQWMAPKIYTSNGRRLTEMETSMDSLFGWWNTVRAADLDKDGDVDLVLGNRGDNMYLKADNASPVKMYINDFDNNGAIEQILTRKVEGKDKPVALKKELTNQIVSLKKKNLKYVEYATKSIEEILPEELLKNSLIKETRIFESVVAYQTEDLDFEIVQLPAKVQLSSVNEILIDDLNQDGFPDLLLGGNDFDYKPQFGRLDAGFFHLLTGSKDGFQETANTGVKGTGVVRSVQEINIQNQKHLLIGINDERAQVYKFK
ncbi:VCBS repeat-containing protein [uncultured Draconibacterium sp.]|uniref:VCBS repeat-containing protein n=1 Tax=uncultured Draconibacterium sp. TaxID=1573823 RepID=UPI003217C8E7